ncbi:MAG: AAA family ATPase, partial [Bacteroidota bacterium]
MKRLYKIISQKHIEQYSQMLFLAGPRQVGKTTVAQQLLEERNGIYLNWDNPNDRILILGDYRKIMEKTGPKKLGSDKPLIIFDEIHKFKDWKNHLKGFYDLYKSLVQIIVTGSAKLDVYHKGGDSLMGRYFPHTVHPLSLRECIDHSFNEDALIQMPFETDNLIYDRLYQ